MELFNFFKVIVFAALYGIFEAEAAMNGWQAGKKVILDHFAWYHVRMLIMFIIAAIPQIWTVPLALLVEDIVFYTFLKEKQLNPESWVTWFWGGFWVGKQWIPWSYGILAGLSLIFYILFQT